MASDKSEPWKVPLVSLGNNLIEARELAAVLEETLGVRVDYGTVIHRSATTSQLRGHTFKERLQAGIPTPIGTPQLYQKRLSCETNTFIMRLILNIQKCSPRARTFAG